MAKNHDAKRSQAMPFDLIVSLADAYEAGGETNELTLCFQGIRHLAASEPVETFGVKALGTRLVEIVSAAGHWGGLLEAVNDRAVKARRRADRASRRAAVADAQAVQAATLAREAIVAVATRNEPVLALLAAAMAALQTP